MKFTIEKAPTTSEEANKEIIDRCKKATDGLTRIEEAYNSIREALEGIMSYECGKGGNHIWVSNWKNERLILITE